MGTPNWIVDEDGVIHYVTDTYEITQEMWDTYVSTCPRPECVGSIRAKVVTGPGMYYLSGSDYDTGYDVWKRVAKVLSSRDELLGQHLSMFDELTNVEFQVVSEYGAEETSYSITKSITRVKLINWLKTGDVEIPAISPRKGGCVSLAYVCNNDTFYVPIIISNNSESCFYDFTDPVIIASIETDKDYVHEFLEWSDRTGSTYQEAFLSEINYKK